MGSVKKVGALLAWTLWAIAGCGSEDAPRRIDLDLGDAPVRGAASAAVTIVEFIDFECPYCAAGVRRTKALLERYPEVLRIAFKHYPLTGLHERAMPAAVAAECAKEQGAFWEMADRLTAEEAGLSEEDLRVYAAELGLDVPMFDGCRRTQPPALRVQNDWREGKSLGLQGTPTFFINGLEVVGLPTFEAFVELVEDELAAVAAP